MIQVRDVFQVKFGSIDQAVALFARLPQDRAVLFTLRMFTITC